MTIQSTKTDKLAALKKVTEKKEETKTVAIFYSTISSCRYAFLSGKIAHFMGGVYRTDDMQEIEELANEVDKGHPIIFVDPNRISEEINVDPLADMKNKIREEERQKLLEELNQNQNAAMNMNLGGTETQKLTPTNSESIQAAATGSASGQAIATNSGAVKGATVSPKS